MVGLVGLLPGRLVVVWVVGRGRAVVTIGFLVVVGLLPGRLVIVGLAVVHDGLVVNGGIGVVNFGLVHDDVVVWGCEEPNIAQEALQ